MITKTNLANAKIVNNFKTKALIENLHSYLCNIHGSEAAPKAFKSNFLSLGMVVELYFSQQKVHSAKPPYLIPAEYTTSFKSGGILSPCFIQRKNLYFACDTVSFNSHKTPVSKIFVRINLQCRKIKFETERFITKLLLFQMAFFPAPIQMFGNRR